MLGTRRVGPSCENSENAFIFSGISEKNDNIQGQPGERDLPQSKVSCTCTYAWMYTPTPPNPHQSSCVLLAQGDLLELLDKPEGQ